jgi:two-component system, chemotaxis family, chemotaxis protein CheY
MKLRALVVDDSRVMRNMMMISLRRTDLAEFEFTEAEDGNDALAKFSPKHTDIMFVDWNMPNLTGIEFIRQVKASGQAEQIPIVMITSEKTVGRLEEALDEVGVDEYITKPFTTDLLKRKLAPLVASIQAHRADHSSIARGFFGRLVGGGGS